MSKWLLRRHAVVAVVAAVAVNQVFQKLKLSLNFPVNFKIKI